MNIWVLLSLTMQKRRPWIFSFSDCLSISDHVTLFWRTAPFKFHCFTLVCIKALPLKITKNLNITWSEMAGKGN